MRIETIINDYVIYQESDYGIISTQTKLEYAKILEIKPNSEPDQQLRLRILSNEQEITCNYGRIRPIEVENTLLTQLGFTEIWWGNSSVFSLANLKIASFQIKSNIASQYGTIPYLGYLGHLNISSIKDVDDLNQYFKDGIFDEAGFLAKCPSLHNFNDLCLEVREIIYEFNPEIYLTK